MTRSVDKEFVLDQSTGSKEEYVSLRFPAFRAIFMF